VVLLLGGGAAAYFLLGGEEPVEGEEVVEEEVVEEGEPIYHKLDPTFVVNLVPGGSAKMAQIAIQVYTRHTNVAEYLKANDPMIRHYVLDLLEQQEAQTLLTLEGKEALQQSIMELLRKKLEEGKQKGEIKGVYFTQLVLQ